MSTLPTRFSKVLRTLHVLEGLLEEIPPENVEQPLSDQVNTVIKVDDAENERILQNCHMVGVLPFKLSDDSVSRCSTPISSRSLLHASAMALAAEHLNTGDSSIVSTLGEIRRSTCSNLTFTIEYLDTKDNPGVAVEETFDMIERKTKEYGYRVPCSFVGGVRSAVTTPTALLTGHKGYLEVSGSSTAFELDDRVQYPRFARTIPSEQDNVIPIVTYFADVLKLNYLVLIYMNEPYGNSFAEVLAREIEVRLKAPHIRRIAIDSTGDTIENALKELKKSQYSYVLAAMPNTRFYDDLLEAAFNMGVAGNGGYQWYFSDSFFYRNANLTNKALRMAYNGTGMFRPAAGRLQNDTKFYDFASQLEDLTTSSRDMEYIKNLVSSCPEKSQESANGDNSSSNNSSTRNSTLDTPAFMYDATMAAGISACYAMGRESGSTGFSAETQFNLLSHNTTFSGATGYVNFVNTTASRNFSSVSYELTNYVVEEWMDEETSKNGTSFRAVISRDYLGGEWMSGEGDFVFANGMGMLGRPDELQPIDTQGNQTPMYMKALALSFSTLSILFAIGLAIWTWRNREARVVMASQPFFLYVILFGVVLVACSIIPYSMDDETFPVEVCSKACGAVLWLLFLGLSVVFSALFTKTYRINLIMKNSKKFRRVTVTIRETLLLMTIMLTLNVITLSVMTALKPPTYQRKVLVDDQFERAETTYGQCVWGNQMPYITTLFVINFLIASLSAYQSWKARALSTEFAESKYIFSTLLITLTVLMVGLPVTIMSASIPEIAVFTYSAAVFIFCMAIFLLIFQPKIRFHYKKKGTKKDNTTFIGGLDLEASPAIPADRMSSMVTGNHFGEQILTTASPRVLAMQVVELQTLLQEKERELSEYKCNSKKDENTKTATTTSTS